MKFEIQLRVSSGVSDKFVLGARGVLYSVPLTVGTDVVAV